MKNYKHYNAIINKYNKYLKNSFKEFCGMLADWDHFCEGWQYREMLTEKQKQKTKAEQIKILKAKKQKEFNKWLNNLIEKAEKIAAAEFPTSIYIDVEWKKSPTWGANPNANIIINTSNNYEQVGGRASGCGYDKLSTAVANGLNQSYSALKIIYSLYEQELRKNPKAKPRDVQYGTGYIYPYYEGGVGYGCFRSLFNKAGAKINEWHDTRTTDKMGVIFLRG